MELLRKREMEGQVHQHSRKILHAFFAHPIAGNIDFKDAEQALVGLGAVVEQKHGNKVEITLHGQKATLHHHNHTLTREDIVHVRKWLESCGITAESFPEA
ncbi:hypothetical protein CCR94_09320 [Rhodoblastus sphagnicola]|uniref:Type II toxin-antitoxin system HicA family toxin n=1 Tax=Rhodoblastus sphagnicola TaxID=333368 RepID=A0A2S6NA38_9HYPH|nr:hypothetical protein CCR94_09320 [Rhodoblastus sphagnicola]